VRFGRPSDIACRIVARELGLHTRKVSIPRAAQAAGRQLADLSRRLLGQRHSRLTQITPANVHQLTLAWAFQTGQTQQIKATPILVNGVIYVTTPDNIWALDARTARQLWRYTYPAIEGFHIGHRGAAIYKDFVYLTTPMRTSSRSTRRPARSVGRRDRRREARLLVDQRAAHHPQPPARRRRRRLRQPARHLQVVRSRNRQAAVDLLQHAAAGHAGLEERRRDRRADVDDGHLRSRAQPDVRRAPAIPRRC
jgi:hypothetical protein